MATIFPDVETLVIARLVDYLALNSNPVTDGVAVAAVKPAPDETPYPARIVTVRSDGASMLIRGITRSERIGINVYAATYGDANSLSRIVESIMREIAWGDIKLVETVSAPVRISNDSKEEQRYMTFDLVVKATDN